MPKWLDGHIQNIQDLGPRLRIIHVKIEQKEELKWIPGQFVVMDLPIGQKRLDRWRSYSIANVPNSENLLEFCIVRAPHGRATAYLFESIKIGSPVICKPPGGVFSIMNHLETNLVLICTGTGVAPFRSMLKYLAEKEKQFKRIHLIFGTRYEKDILYRDEFETLAKGSPRFKYSVALSREKFNGYRGYVHDIYMKEYESAEHNTRFYLCGWQNMIDDAVENITEKMGYAKEQVVYELYG